jgi:hypothetical protein
MKGIYPTFLFTTGGLTYRLQVRADTYAAGGGLAVLLIDESDGMYFATASINVKGLNLSDDEFVFKTYSENEGLLEAMLAAGVIGLTGRSVDLGPICRLSAGAQAGEHDRAVDGPPPRTQADVGPVPEWLRKEMP